MFESYVSSSLFFTKKNQAYTLYVILLWMFVLVSGTHTLITTMIGQFFNSVFNPDQPKNAWKINYVNLTLEKSLFLKSCFVLRILVRKCFCHRINVMQSLKNVGFTEINESAEFGLVILFLLFSTYFQTIVRGIFF